MILLQVLRRREGAPLHDDDLCRAARHRLPHRAGRGHRSLPHEEGRECQTKRDRTLVSMLLPNLHPNQVRSIIETNMERGLLNYGKEGYKGVTETWNIVQHDVSLA